MKTGIILGNTGTPDAPTPEAVRSFLKQFLMDKRIAPKHRLVWRYVLNRHILPKRADASAERYAGIWTDEGSPLIATQDKLANHLEELLQAEGFDVAVENGMSYGTPTMHRALCSLKDKDCDCVVLLPLYPQSSYSASYALSDAFEREFKSMKWFVPVHVIRDYYRDSTYLKTIAASIRNAGFPERWQSDVRLVVSFHSIPLSDIEAGDTYREQCKETGAALAAELGIRTQDVLVTYQSVFGHKPETWLAPFSKETLDGFADEGFDGTLFFACPGFPIDCLETLDEIPNSLAAKFLEVVGEDHFVYVPCLGNSRAHLKVLSEVLRPSLAP